MSIDDIRILLDSQKNYLRCGYDAIANPYAVPGQLKLSNPVLIDGVPMDILPERRGVLRTFAGKQRYEVETSYCECCKAEVPVAGLAASLQGAYIQKGNSMRNCAYGRQYLLHTVGRVYRTCGRSDVLSFLSPQFVTDIDARLSPRGLFEKYGTHLLQDIAIGGKLVLDYQKEDVEDRNIDEFKAELAVQDTGYEREKTKSLQRTSKTKQVDMVCLGGKGLISYGKGLSEQREAWVSSLEQDGTLVQVNASTPIWALISDDGYAKEVEHEFYRYCMEVLESYRLEIPFIIDIKVVSLRRFDWRKLTYYAYSLVMDMKGEPADFNEGTAGGRKVYILYKLGTEPRQKITDLLICYEREVMKEGFIRINVDLNDRAIGKGIFLAYRKNPQGSGMTSLESVDNSVLGSPLYSIVRDSAGSETSLNKGALFGKDMYLSYHLSAYGQLLDQNIGKLMEQLRRLDG